MILNWQFTAIWLPYKFNFQSSNRFLSSLSSYQNVAMEIFNVIQQIFLFTMIMNIFSKSFFLHWTLETSSFKFIQKDSTFV